MRITPEQRAAIVDSVREIFGDAARVYLFGSRADDSKKGGDIDIYIDVTDDIDERSIPERKMKLYARICARVGDELPLDIVVKSKQASLIHSEGMRGILL